MKAFKIENGIQYSCELEGESWRQGDLIKGVLEIKSSDIPGRVVLATGVKKKVQAKDPKAFTIVEERSFEAAEQDLWNFEFKLLQFCPISGVYILFGSGDDLANFEVLELPISPNENLTKYLDTLNTFFKFQPKGMKSNKDGFIDVKIAVPTSKEFSNVVSLKLLLKMQDDELKYSYNFVVNKVNYVDAVVKLEKEKVQITNSLGPKEYLIYGDSFNQAKVQDSISEVLEQVKKTQLNV